MSGNTKEYLHARAFMPSLQDEPVKKRKKEKVDHAALAASVRAAFASRAVVGPVNAIGKVVTSRPVVLPDATPISR